MRELIAEICEWQRATFPHATALSCAKHLESEVVELLDDPENPSEIADCFFLVCGAANRAGIDLEKAVREKFEVNKARTWGKPDEHGVSYHERGEPNDQ